MSRVNGHGPRPERGIPSEILNPLTFSLTFLCGQFSSLMAVSDWSTRAQVAQEMSEHLNCLALDLSEVLSWIALHCPDVRRAPGHGLAGGSGDGT